MLIECFKPKAPDVKLFADAGQLAAKPGKLIRWSEREAYLAKAKKKAEDKKAEDKPAK